MKSSFFAALSIPLFIVSILFLQQISFADSQKGEIEKVCARTEAPDLCISIMKSDDPHGIGGRLRRFVLNAFGKALAKAAEVMQDRCPAAYARLVNHVRDAIQEMQNGQIAAAIFSVTAAINDAFSCYHTTIVVAILKIALKVMKLLK